MPNRKKLLEKYGSIGRGANSPTAIASVDYDVLNQRVLDAQKNIKSKARTNLLYTMFAFDRGYASEKLISFIEDELCAGYLFRSAQNSTAKLTIFLFHPTRRKLLTV